MIYNFRSNNIQYNYCLYNINFVSFLLLIYKIDIRTMVRAQTNIDLMMHERGIKTDLELANKIGMSQQQLSQRLAGKITMNTLEKLASFFQVSVKELLR